MEKQLRIKPSLYILEESSDRYKVIFTSTRVIKTFQVDDLVKETIKELANPRTEGDFLRTLSKKFNPATIESCLKALEGEGVIERYTKMNIDEKYQKQVSFLGELSGSLQEAVELQKKLEKTKIAVFGVGGIGSWMVNGLYQIGIGELRIVDPDIVEKSNLNRQLYYDTQDVGRNKVEVIKEKVRDAHIIPFKRWVSEETDLEEIVEGCDFLVNCTDSPSVADTTRIISKYAKKHSQPYMISGGYNLHLGMVGPIIVPGKTACFDCFLAHQVETNPLKNLKKIKDIEQTGNIGPIAGAIANIQVMEIFKFLTGKGSYNANRFAEINFMDLSLEWRKFEKRENCDC